MTQGRLFRSTSWDRLRLVVATLSLLIALSAVVDATSIPHWLLSVGATEYGHWFSLLPLAILLTTRPRWLNGLGSLLSVAALVIYLIPAFSAWRLAATLPAKMAAALGPVEIKEAPFSWSRLIFGDHQPAIVPETLTYSSHDGEALKLDLYRSASTAPSPCVIVLHTGGWNTGTRHEFLKFNSHLARRGFTVASIEYRLAPRWTWPAQRDDVAAAIAYLKQHSSALNIDPTRFVLMGRSAGGHIAETAAYSLHDPAIRACIALYSPADMQFAYLFGDENDMLKSPRLLRQFLGGTPQEKPENYNSASAIQFVSPATPPTLLLHGRKDGLVWFRQSERLEKSLTEAGVPHFFLVLPWATHAFDFNPTGPGGQLAEYAVDYFLAAELRK